MTLWYLSCTVHTQYALTSAEHLLGKDSKIFFCAADVSATIVSGVHVRRLVAQYYMYRTKT